MSYQFIADHRQILTVTAMGRVLSVSRSGYDAWRKRRPSAREMVGHALLVEIRTIYRQTAGLWQPPDFPGMAR